MADVTYAYVGDIEKYHEEDGSLIVYGKATGPDLDLDEQICDPSWLREAMPEWMKFGNVREMHQPIAAGVGIDLEAKGDDWFLKSEVVDPGTARKIEAGALKGYSVGIKGAKVVKDDTAKGGRIVGGTIVEVSYVDRPCNPTAIAGIAKVVGGEWEPEEAVKVDRSELDKADAPEIAGTWKPEDTYQPQSTNQGEYPSDYVCAVCDGLGKYPETGAKCDHCNGTGRVANQPAEAGKPTAEIVDSAEQKDAEAEVEKKDYSDAERKEMDAKGQAMPGGGFPIKTVADLKNAIQAIGRAKDPAATKTHIKARAKALGRADLIPDGWKGADADTQKVEHDTADLEAVRQSLIALIKAELDEMANAEEDEICDVRDLVCALQIFLNWWDGEAAEGETPQPFATNNDKQDDTEAQMAYIGLGVSADTIKAAKDGTDETRLALRDEVLKALDLTEIITETAKAAQREEVDFLKAELERIKEMAAPGGPALARTQAQSSKALDAERTKSEADRLRHVAAQITDPETRGAYEMKALQLDKTAAELLGN